SGSGLRPNRVRRSRTSKNKETAVGSSSFDMTEQPQSVFRTAALARYPRAILCGDGPWGVILYDGKITIQFFKTVEEAKRLAKGGFRIMYFGPPVVSRPFKHRMDREDD